MLLIGLLKFRKQSELVLGNKVSSQTPKECFWTDPSLQKSLVKSLLMHLRHDTDAQMEQQLPTCLIPEGPLKQVLQSGNFCFYLKAKYPASI